MNHSEAEQHDVGTRLHTADTTNQWALIRGHDNLHINDPNLTSSPVVSQRHCADVLFEVGDLQSAEAEDVS